MKKQGWIVAGLSVVLLGTAAFYGYQTWNTNRSNARTDALGMMPADASAVVFMDFAELRTAPFITQLYAWAPKPQADPDYQQFLKETGFDYERDLDCIAIAIFKSIKNSTFLAVATGRFDRQKISAYALQHGRWNLMGNKKFFVVPSSDGSQQLLFMFPHDNQIILTNDAAGSDKMRDALRLDAGRAEWHARFERLAGSPIFAVIRQDAAAGAAIAAQAPGGFRSPQLSTLLDQLQWITIAGKPENDRLRVVAEGESAAETTTRQLADLLNGVVILAEAGLNDAKTRQQLDPAARSAYLELLKSADLSKIDRGDTKSVRLTFELALSFFEAARRAPIGSPTPAPTKPPPGKASHSRKGHT